MADYAVIVLLLLGSYRNAVYLAGDIAEIAERTLPHGLPVEGRRQREAPVGAAEAVHLGKCYIARERNMIEWLFCYKSEKSCRSSTRLSHYYIDIVSQSSFLLSKLIKLL